MMRHKKSCPSGSLTASTSSSSSSPVSSSLSTSLTSLYTPPSPRPLCSPPAHMIEHCTLPTSSSSFPLPASKQKRTSCTWVSRFLQLGKLSSMEAEEGFLLQQRALEGVLYVDGKLAEEKPKKELRFAAKIAVAMDADGFIGVKNSVCTDDALIEVKHNINDSHYCVPSPCSSSLQRKERPPSKQAHPLRRRRWWRRWKLFGRIRRTRVLFACLFQKVTKAFASSSKKTLGAHDKFIK